MFFTFPSLMCTLSFPVEVFILGYVLYIGEV